MYLSGAYKITEWDPELVQQCLEAMTPNNMFIMISSPTFAEGDQCNEVEQWYGSKYRSLDFDPALLKKWSEIRHDEYPALQLPQVNDMIATDFTLLDAASSDACPKDEPQCIHQDDNVRLWYKPDNVFDMPKVNIMYSFSSGQGAMTPSSLVAANLFAELVQELCNEFSYLATMAGLHCDISSTASGLELQISGYNHKAHVLVEKLVDTIMDLTNDVDGKKVDPEMFDRISYKVEQQYQSFLVGQPYQHAIYGGDIVLEHDKYTIYDKLNAVKGMTLAEVFSFAKVFWKYCRLDGLIHGNVSPQHAYDITSMVWSKTHPLQPKSMDAVITRGVLGKRIVQLSNGNESSPTSYLYRFPEFNESNTNSCVEIVYQMGVLDMTTNAMLAFINHIVREPAFNQLRTEEQLGYIVHTSVKTSGDNIKGLLFLIQSDSFDPIHVESRIETFLANFRQRIVDMSSEDFQTNVDSVVASFLEKVRRLSLY
jgi:insulysin